MKKIINKKNLTKLTGLIIFVLIIIFKIDFGKFYQLVSNLNPLHLILASSIMLVPTFIKVIRWRYILKKLGINRCLKEISKIYYISLMISHITPAYLGEIPSKIVLLKGDDHQVSSSFTSIIIDRLNDLIILLVIAIGGIFLFLPLLKIKNLIVAISVLLILILILFGIKIELLKKILKKIFFLTVPKKWQSQSKKHLKNILSGFKKMTAKDIAVTFGLTILTYSLIWLFLYVLAQILGINQVPPLFLLLIYTITRFVIMIPVTISGFGTREITMLALFSSFSVQNELVIIYSLLMFFLFAIPTFLIGSYFWLTEPLIASKKNRENPSDFDQNPN